MMMLRTLLVMLMVAACVTDAIKFEGCFRDMDESVGVSYQLPGSNLNVDCAYFCGSTGYILSATKKGTCHCTNKYPVKGTLLESPYDVMLDGDVHCTTICPGAEHTLEYGDDCEGDICCGNSRNNYYTVYAVGGIDLKGAILKRIKKAVASGEMPWIHEAYTSRCHDDFTQFIIPHDLYVKIRGAELKIDTRIVGSIDTCRERCLEIGSTCRAFTFGKTENKCVLYSKSTVQADVEPAGIHTVLFDRNCTYQVHVLPASFQVDMLNQDSFLASQPGTDKKPLDNQDFEFDLTYSNSFDKMLRSVDVTVGETASYSTDSGFDIGSSESTTNTTTETEDETSGSSHTKESSESSNFGVSVTTSASVGIGIFSGSASVGVSSNFGFSSSSSDTVAKERSSSTSTHRSISEELSKSESFNSGFNQVFHSTKATTMSYSLTVPALHKGMLTFSKEKRKTVLKIRSTFQLNGYLKFRMNDLQNKTVHVSRVLRANDRLFATFNTMVFERPVITAKATIRDKKGNVVENGVDEFNEYD